MGIGFDVMLKIAMAKERNTRIKDELVGGTPSKTTWTVLLDKMLFIVLIKSTSIPID